MFYPTHRAVQPNYSLYKTPLSHRKPACNSHLPPFLLRLVVLSAIHKIHIVPPMPTFHYSRPLHSLSPKEQMGFLLFPARILPRTPYPSYRALRTIRQVNQVFRCYLAFITLSVRPQSTNGYATRCPAHGYIPKASRHIKSPTVIEPIM